jgi:hypothetical protein
VVEEDIWALEGGSKMRLEYSLPNFIRVIKSRWMRWAGYVTHTGEKRNVYRVLVEKPDVKTPLHGPKYRWEYNIKISLKK